MDIINKLLTDCLRIGSLSIDATKAQLEAAVVERFNLSESDIDLLTEKGDKREKDGYGHN